MANLTTNQSPLIKGQVFSEYLLQLIQDGFLPDGLHRDVSDFTDGDLITIPVLGEGVLRDYTENSDIQFDAIDSGTVTLAITDYVASGTYISDKLKSDGYKVAALEAAIPGEQMRLIRERYETDMLAQCNKQTLSSPNLINNFAHRWVAGSGTTDGVLTLEDIAYAKASFDKAYVPDEGRIFIVDAVTELSLNQQVGSQAFINNPMFEGLVTSGFARGKRFVRNIFGFDIWVSDRLPTVTETINGGPHASSKSVTNGNCNIFMSVYDDQHKPFMGAWREMPRIEGFRNATKRRDEYSTTARWGFNLQRFSTLITVLTSATAYK